MSDPDPNLDPGPETDPDAEPNPELVPVPLRQKVAFPAVQAQQSTEKKYFYFMPSYSNIFAVQVNKT
jgi:hypothetical protein